MDYIGILSGVAAWLWMFINAIFNSIMAVFATNLWLGLVILIVILGLAYWLSTWFATSGSVAMHAIMIISITLVAVILVVVLWTQLDIGSLLSGSLLNIFKGG